MIVYDNFKGLKNSFYLQFFRNFISKFSYSKKRQLNLI